jgi:hypothetical protein
VVQASILKSPQKASDGEAHPRLILVSSTLPPKRVQNITIEKVLRASGTDTAAHEEARRNNDLLAGDRRAGQGRLGPSPRQTRVALTIARESEILGFTEAAISRSMPKGRRRRCAHIAGGEKVAREKLEPNRRQTRAALTIARESAILDFIEAAISRSMPKGRRRRGAHIARPKGVDILNTRATLPSHLP